MKLKSVGYVFAVLILVVAAISFIGIPSLGRFNAVKTLASWDGRAITNEPGSPFFDKLQSVQRIFETFGGAVPKEPGAQEFFHFQVMNTAMTSALVDLAMQTEVEKMGYKPSDKLINLGLMQQYTDPQTGLFSQEAYDKAPEASKLELKTKTIENLKRSRYIQDMFGYGGNFGLKTSSKEAGFVAKMNSEKRAVEYVSFKPLLFPKEKVKEYAIEHKDLFVKYDLSIVSFEDERAATTVSKEIVKGNVSFEDAIKNQSEDVINVHVDENGKLTSSYRKDLNALFPNAEDLAKVVDLKPGEVSTPLKMNALYVVLKCDGEPVQPDFTNETLISEVSYYMRQYEKGIIEDYLVSHANDFIKAVNETSFNEAALSFEVEPAKTESFAINYGNSQFLQALPTNDPLLSGVQENEAFFKEVFSLKEGELTKPFLVNESAFVARLVEVTNAEKEDSDSSLENYKNSNQNWTEYYTLTLLTRQFPLSVSQANFIDYIMSNPKTKNDLNKFTN
ncbi:MAG: peptidylprolyl isomerase [Treponemataceae bacterium]